MTLDQSFPVTDYFEIYFTENAGMAFGWTWGGKIGKLALSLFRIIACVVITIYLRRLILRKEKPLLIFTIAMILSGAAGNIIDSMFYGLLFNESIHEVAQFMPEGGGYEGFLFGHVVDMLHFPLFKGHYPDWFPFWGGQEFEFFRPIFNLADAWISIGVILLLLFHRRLFTEHPLEPRKPKEGEMQNPGEDNASDHVPFGNQ
jgi:signal peptidase II